MVGHVKTYAMDINSIEAGSIAVIRGTGLLDICTVQHLDPNGSWVVEGQHYSGPLTPEMTLCTLVVMSADNQYPLKFNQWKKSIKADEVDSEKEVTFEVNSAKFVEGHYSNTCSLCHSSFMAHKRQPVCKSCCDENTHAKILISKKVKPAKLKRPRLLSQDKAKTIARAAYTKGAFGNMTSETFEKWLDNQF
jgi:hypothetical protein